MKTEGELSRCLRPRRVGMPNRYLEPQVHTLEQHCACGELGQAVIIRDDYRFICHDHLRPGLAAALLFLFVTRVEDHSRDLDLCQLLCGAWQASEVFQARQWLSSRHLIEAEYTSYGVKYWPNFVLIEMGQKRFLEERLKRSSFVGLRSAHE